MSRRISREEVRTIVTDLPVSVKGFVFLDATGSPCIVLNARMSAEIQRKTYRHEVDHILRGELENFDYREYTQ